MFNLLKRWFTIQVPEDQLMAESARSRRARFASRDARSAITHLKAAQQVGITREKKNHHLKTAEGLMKSVHKYLVISDWS